jgi:hypothetical protein
MIHINREIMNYSKEDPMNVLHLRNKPCYSSSKEREAPMRDFTLSFIKIGTRLCFIRNHL